MIKDLGVVLTFKTTDSSYSCNCKITNDKDEICTVTASLKFGKGKSISVPSEKNTVMVDDMDDLEDWTDGVDWNKFIDKLSKTDMPSDWIDVIEDICDMLEDGDYQGLYWYM
jgi:hypothetical protein